MILTVGGRDRSIIKTRERERAIKEGRGGKLRKSIGWNGENVSRGKRMTKNTKRWKGRKIKKGDERSVESSDWQIQRRKG